MSAGDLIYGCTDKHKAKFAVRKTDKGAMVETLEDYEYTEVELSYFQLIELKNKIHDFLVARSVQ